MNDVSVNGAARSRFRGVFAIPPTPFDDAGNVDEASLRRCVDFCVEAGAHGIVAPVNASESIALTDAERLRVTDVLVEQAAARVPVVVGVSGVSGAASVLYTRQAVQAGTAAVISMQPCATPAPADETQYCTAETARAAG